MLSAALTDLTASMAVNDARNRWMTVRRVTLGTRSAEASGWPEMGSVLFRHYGYVNVEAAKKT